MPRIEVPTDQVFTILEQNVLVDGFHIVIDLQKSHDSVMVDAVRGKEYLDCYAYFATLSVGHNHPKMCDEQFHRSLLTAALSNPANSDVYSREYAGFVQEFRRVAAPAEFEHLFFVAGGSVAVENAMKTAFDWKAQRNRAAGVDGGADKILHFRDAFHGRTGYTLSVTNTDPTKTKYFPKFNWPRISNPAIHFPMDEGVVASAEEEACREIEAAFQADPHGIAAILIEPIQAEGGDHHFRPEFFTRLREYADRHDALLIFDEVQTGLGTTGSMWAYQQLGVTPDVLAFGKKTQVCGIMSTKRVDEVKHNVFTVSSRINSTWGGNLVNMVRCARILQIIEQDNLVENAARVGAVFKKGLEALERDIPAVTNARGRGFMLAFDLPDGAARDKVRSDCWDAGLATLTCGPRTIRFRPPLIFTEDDTAAALKILRDVLT